MKLFAFIIFRFITFGDRLGNFSTSESGSTANNKEEQKERKGASKEEDDVNEHFVGLGSANGDFSLNSVRCHRPPAGPSWQQRHLEKGKGRASGKTGVLRRVGLPYVGEIYMRQPAAEIVLVSLVVH